MRAGLLDRDRHGHPGSSVALDAALSVVPTPGEVAEAGRHGLTRLHEQVDPEARDGQVMGQAAPCYGP